jgi:serine/threonine protein kinase
MFSLIDAVDYLHSSSVYHRDIKLTNIVYQKKKNGERVAKLIDFGMVVTDANILLYSVCGTLPYMAPEMIKMEGHHPGPLDVWALGIVFFELLTGHNPFYGLITS